MDTDDNNLPLWYEHGDASNGTLFLGRKSSACQSEVYQDVCDYQLFPICRRDADILLFNTVWDLVMYPDFKDFHDNTDIRNSNVQFTDHSGEIKWYRPCLLFPADQPYTDFTEEELRHHFMVGACSWKCHAYGESGIYEEDTNPQFRVYYTPEWDFSKVGWDIVYRENVRRIESDMPSFVKNTKELEYVICQLLQFFEDNNISEINNWKERLRCALLMLKTHANELHILHNAGLYDIDTLWTQLIQMGYHGEELNVMSSKMNRELHRFAMFSVNLIDWKLGDLDTSRIIPKSMLPENQPSDQESSSKEIQGKNTETLKATFFSVPAREPGQDNGGYDDVKMIPTKSDGGYKWDEVYPRYPFSSENLTEPSYVDKILPKNWWNDIGSMEQAFQWTDEEKQILDNAYNKGTYGKAPFGDDLGEYVEVLRNLVRRRLKTLALEEFEAERRGWLFHNSR